MSEIVNKHNWPAGVGSLCYVCGASRQNTSDAGTELSCINRVVPETSRSRPPSASQDYDAIGARLAELREEQDAILAAPPDEPAPIPMIDYGGC